MKRVKRHRIKHEKPETSSAFIKAREEHDLAYYLHDRVELMHQVFSILKAKDLKAMAPESVRRLTIDDLQELCTEELLGISSKRLLAILDGAEPPSDTESSSQSSEQVEAISLDSISSDEEILSQGTKKKRKHKCRDSKSKKHKSKKPPEEPQEDLEKSKASRAGLTVLELLELQARARAIRAQLQQEQAKRSEAVQSVTGVDSSQTSDSDIEVKEEPAEVVEIISSDDEKPQIDKLENAITSAKEPEKTPEITPVEKAQKTNDSAKSKKKKDKSKKKDKEKKRKESTNSKDGDKITKETTLIQEPDKANDKGTEKSRTDSTASTETDTTTPLAIEGIPRVTKRVNDLIITVPQQSSRKIKLNRNKMTVSVSNNEENEVIVVDKPRSVSSVVTRPDKQDSAKKISSVVSRPRVTESVAKPIDNHNDKATKPNQDKNAEKLAEKIKNKDKLKKKQKKKEKRRSIDEDHDEITLQLSDSEKMDLLENFDKRNYDDVSSSSSDSDSSSDSSDSEGIKDKSKELDNSQEKVENTTNNAMLDNSQNGAVNASHDEAKNMNNTTDCEHDAKKSKNVESVIENSEDNTIINNTENTSIEISKKKNNDDEEESNSAKDDHLITTDVNKTAVEENNVPVCSLNNKSTEITTEEIGYIPTENDPHKVIVISTIDDIPVQDDSEKESQNISNPEQNQNNSPKSAKIEESNPTIGDHKNNDETLAKEPTDESQCSDKELSEGELSERESSEVEAFELQPEVVCISDEETPKKKKKDKKHKKDKKKKLDFRESADQNFFKDSDDQKTIENYATPQEKQKSIIDDDDDVYEILELSDDSSCYEVEGTTLSKEPTVEEIAALSAKIDEIEREEVVTEQEIQIHEEQQQQQRNNIAEEIGLNEEIENISWKDRYLDSKKVRKVLTTANILNALRKKNKDLKKKIEESKKQEQELEAQKEAEEKEKQKLEKEPEKVLEEGSIEHYNTLEASTKYVDPVLDPVELAKQKEEELKEQHVKEAEIIKEKEKEIEEAIEAQVTGEMKKDAKQLLKMYKKLLKYNDINKQKDPNKKKTNKKKKKKEKDNIVIAGQ